MAFYTDIVANRRNGAIYTGSTDDLVRRIWEHKSKAIPGFTAKHGRRVR
jgi:putative endonuclease